MVKYADFDIDKIEKDDIAYERKVLCDYCKFVFLVWVSRLQMDNEEQKLNYSPLELLYS